MPKESRKMDKKPRFMVHLGVAAGLVLLGLVGLAVLTLSKSPMAQRRPEPVLPLVKTVTVELAPRTVEIEGEGAVSPLRRSTLASEVKGRVIYTSPDLVDGGQVSKGEVLVKVERKDYELAVTLAQAKVKEAATALKKVQEDAEAALEEWKRYQGKGTRAAPPLVAREPQLDEARAKLAAAQAQLEQAQLNLQRTEIRAPYEGRLSAKYVDLGQYLRVGDKVASLYGTDAAEVVVHLEDDALAWLAVPGLTQKGGQGSAAEVYIDFSGGRISWQGRVVRALGELDTRTRMVPVVVRVDKPFASQPPLSPGMFVKVDIQGKTLDDAALLPRAALRQGGLVWVVDEAGTMKFRKVKVARTHGTEALIKSGLAHGEKVVTTQLQAVSNGMAVRVNGAPAKAKATPQDPADNAKNADTEAGS
jgi:RND family efflux transporter MFP subunit